MHDVTLATEFLHTVAPFNTLETDALKDVARGLEAAYYPQDKSVLEACDELGVLAIEPIPGWQFFNNDEQFSEYTFQNIRDMIRRDRNHPSVIMWEV